MPVFEFLLFRLLEHLTLQYYHWIKEVWLKWITLQNKTTFHQTCLKNSRTFLMLSSSWRDYPTPPPLFSMSESSRLSSVQYTALRSKPGPTGNNAPHNTSLANQFKRPHFFLFKKTPGAATLVWSLSSQDLHFSCIFSSFFYTFIKLTGTTWTDKEKDVTKSTYNSVFRLPDIFWASVVDPNPHG